MADLKRHCQLCLPFTRAANGAEFHSRVLVLVASESMILYDFIKDATVQRKKEFLKKGEKLSYSFAVII